MKKEGEEREEEGGREREAARNKGQQPIRYMDHSRGKHSATAMEGAGRKGMEDRHTR